MKKRAVLFALAVFSMSGAYLTADEKQPGNDDGAAPQLVVPSSWDDWRDYRVSGGDLGIWVTEGETGEIWEGIPAGLKYKEFNETRLSNGGDRIRPGRQMLTADAT